MDICNRRLNGQEMTGMSHEREFRKGLELKK